jgi:mercuric ion transport protein
MMGDFLKQIGSTLGAAFAAACCLGATAVISALTVVGAGFLINDAFLIPLYAVLLGLSLWLLYRSARAHGGLTPFWAGAGGALVALIGLWIQPLLVYGGLAVMVLASVADYLRRRRNATGR